MLVLQLPKTESKLVIQDGTEMYIRLVEVWIGGRRLQLHQCERRIKPLFAGEDSDDMERVNLLRLLGATNYIDRCQLETLHLSPIRKIGLHLAPERNGWHTMFEVWVMEGEAKIHVCNPSWPVNHIYKMLAIE